MNPIRKTIVGAVMVGATLSGGALGAFLTSGTSNAATTTTTQAAAPQNGTQQGPGPQGQGRPQGRPQGDPTKGGHTANGITETLLTGDTAVKAKAAALAAVPGATVQRVENDAEGATYEAHVTKSDGSQATVKMDASFQVTSIDSH